MKQKVYIDEAGCTRRKLDLERIRTYLELNDYVLVHSPEQADRIIVATCAFKKKEEDDSVARLHELKKYADKIVVFGCLPDIAPERFAQFDNLPKVAPKELDKIQVHFAETRQPFADISDAHLLAHGRALPDWRGMRRNLTSISSDVGLFSRDFFHQTMVATGMRLRALMTRPAAPYFLTVCRGCLGKCSYCAIRRSIGTVKSKPVAAVCDDFCAGIAKGYRNFAILGDDPGCYGVDIGSSLPELLEALVEQCATIGQAGRQKHDRVGLHLKEIHPKFLIAHADTLIKKHSFTYITDMLCPIQSGSDRILELMGREHTMPKLGNVLRTIKGCYPSTVLTSQIIVGFPGEKESDFQQTLEAVRDCAFQSVVVFPYDNKEGTEAAELPDKVPQRVIRKRMRAAFRYFESHKIQAYYNCPT